LWVRWYVNEIPNDNMNVMVGCMRAGTWNALMSWRTLSFHSITFLMNFSLHPHLISPRNHTMFSFSLPHLLVLHYLAHSWRCADAMSRAFIMRAGSLQLNYLFLNHTHQEHMSSSQYIYLSHYLTSTCTAYFELSLFPSISNFTGTSLALLQVLVPPPTDRCCARCYDWTDLV
jgi:hypothetical protein